MDARFAPVLPWQVPKAFADRCKAKTFRTFYCTYMHSRANGVRRELNLGIIPYGVHAGLALRYRRSVIIESGLARNTHTIHPMRQGVNRTSNSPTNRIVLPEAFQKLVVFPGN